MDLGQILDWTGDWMKGRICATKEWDLMTRKNQSNRSWWANGTFYFMLKSYHPHISARPKVLFIAQYTRIVHQGSGSAGS